MLRARVSQLTLLQLACTDLFGRGGQTDVAEALAVDDRTLRRWLSKDRKPPADLLPRLDKIATDRIAEIKQLQAMIRRTIREGE